MHFRKVCLVYNGHRLNMSEPESDPEPAPPTQRTQISWHESCNIIGAKTKKGPLTLVSVSAMPKACVLKFTNKFLEHISIFCFVFKIMNISEILCTYYFWMEGNLTMRSTNTAVCRTKSELPLLSNKLQYSKYSNADIYYGYDNKSMQNRFMDRFWDLPNAPRCSLESILSLDFNSRWRSNLLFIRTFKCSWRRVLKSAWYVISPRLRMLLWRGINVNTAQCEHPCNSLQPFGILWMIILGSSVSKDLETSRERLFLKHAAPSDVQN